MKEYAKSFYQSDAWKKARQTAIKRANGLCERCRAAGRFVPGVIVHHKKYITPGNIHDARVTLALDNLELVCEDCHNKSIRRSTPHVTDLTETGTCCRRQEKRRGYAPRWAEFWRGRKNRGRYLKKTPQGRTHMRGDEHGGKEKIFFK